MPLVEADFRGSERWPSPESVSHLLSFGPTLWVEVRPLVALALPDRSSALSQPLPALIDTGAQESCIDIQLADRFRLPQVDIMKMAGISGEGDHPVFAAQVIIAQLGMSQYGRFAGVDLTGGGQLHSVLLGRTFLQNAVMIYDGHHAQVTIGSPSMIG